MKIHVDKYTLHSDGLCFYITEQQPTGDKSKYDYRDERVSGYATNITNLIRSFAEKQLKESDATTIEELLDDMERIYKDMLMLNTAAVEHGLKLARKKRGIDD